MQPTGGQGRQPGKWELAAKPAKGRRSGRNESWHIDDPDQPKGLALMRRQPKIISARSWSKTATKPSALSPRNWK